MNNRNPNKQNTYTNLAAWCEKYHKDSGIKIHPSSIPVELVLEDVMGYVALLMNHNQTNIALIDSLATRLVDLETLVHELASQLTEKVRDSVNKSEDSVMVRGVPVPINDLIGSKKTTQKVKK